MTGGGKGEAHDGIRKGSETPVAPYEIGCAGLKTLYEPGKDEDNKKALLEFGGECA